MGGVVMDYNNIYIPAFLVEVYGKGVGTIF